jgi:hypothetical protein
MIDRIARWFAGEKAAPIKYRLTENQALEPADASFIPREAFATAVDAEAVVAFAEARIGSATR